MNFCGTFAKATQRLFTRGAGNKKNCNFSAKAAATFQGSSKKLAKSTRMRTEHQHFAFYTL